MAYKNAGGILVLVSLNLKIENCEFKDNICKKGFGGAVKIAYNGADENKV